MWFERSRAARMREKKGISFMRACILGPRVNTRNITKGAKDGILPAALTLPLNYEFPAHCPTATRSRDVWQKQPAIDLCAPSCCNFWMAPRPAILTSCGSALLENSHFWKIPPPPTISIPSNPPPGMHTHCRVECCLQDVCVVHRTLTSHKCKIASEWQLKYIFPVYRCAVHHQHLG